MNDKLVSFVKECIDAMLDGNPWHVQSWCSQE